MARLVLLSALLALAAPALAQPDYDALVVSQGAFGATNGSVVSVDREGSSVVGTTLATGRIYTQGAEIDGDRLYLTAGDSFSGTSRIDVLDTATGALVEQITGDGIFNPRYLAVLPSGKAFVTGQDYSGGSSFVTPVDLDTRDVGAPILVEGTPEGLTLAYTDGGVERLFVALGAFGGKDSLAVIDPAAEALIGYVDIDCEARFVVGTFERVWAVCTDTDEAVGVDPTTLEVTQRIAFGVEIGDPNGIGQDAAPIQIGIPTRRSGPPISDSFVVSTGTGLVVVDGFQGEIFATIPIADTDTRPITAIAVAEFGAGFYLGRPDPDNPFGANGTVTVHDPDGTLVGTLPAGVFPAYAAINPGNFVTDAAPGPGAGGLGLVAAGPNPMRGASAVALTLAHAADVRVEVVDVLGRTVATLAAGPLPAGTHRLGVDAGALAPGTYLVRATADGAVTALPLTVTR